MKVGKSAAIETAAEKNKQIPNKPRALADTMVMLSDRKFMRD
ncbi:hypothetical protein CPter291_3003 [Collimonas pratensis]|uniref:Uncharacterized protein n=1 Tax=Collimonas pratensis TaxID=279113 RepID=A0ABM5Z8P3_9BURK|nr:hypothetical protein CPter291_3003 [Collimonas pratensis]